MQNACKMSFTNLQVERIWFLWWRWQDELSAGSDQRLQFGNPQGATVEMHFINLAFELRSVLNSTDVQADCGVVQVSRSNSSGSDFVAVDKQISLL